MASQQPRIPKKQQPTRERMPEHVPVSPAPPDLIYSRRPPRVHQQKPPGDAKRKRAARKRLPRTHRTLAVLLQAVRDEQLTFEMKDGTSVSGALYEVDANLNAHLSDATVTRRDGSARRLEATYVNGSSVLYVLFPDRVDALRSLDRYLDSKVRVERTETRAKRAAPAAADRPPAAPAISLPAPAVMRGHDRPEI